MSTSDDLKICPNCEYPNAPLVAECAACGYIFKEDAGQETASPKPTVIALGQTKPDDTQIKPERTRKYRNEEVDEQKTTNLEKVDAPPGRREEPPKKKRAATQRVRRRPPKPTSSGFVLKSDETDEEHSFQGQSIMLNRSNIGDGEDDTSISGEKHAEFIFKNGMWYVKDHSTYQETYIQVQGEMPIKQGAKIIIGKHTYYFNPLD